MPDADGFLSIEQSRAVLLAEIGSAPELTLICGPGNLGDHLIRAGARTLLNGHVYREIGIGDLAGVEGDTALIIGGGAWCRTYHEWMPALFRVVEERFDRVIVLPSTFDPEEDCVRDALLTSRATVFTREYESYRRVAGLCNARMAHDCAFFFDYGGYLRPGSGTLDAFRTDGEAAGDGALPSGNHDISLTASTLHDWLTTIADHAVVRTDRAHVLIAAALMGKEVEYAPCSHFKVDALAAMLPPGVAVRRIGSGRVQRSGWRSEPPLAPARERMAATALGRPAAATVRPAADGARICVVILSRERPDHVATSVRSVIASGDGVRVLVLDANSGPLTRARLEALGREVQFDLHRTNRSPGCSGGRAFALDLTTEELILFLDDDAELLPGALELLVADLDAHPEAQAVSALVADPEGRVSHCGGSLELSAGMARFTLDGGGLPFDSPDLPPAGRCDWVGATAVLVRRSLLEECPLDPEMRAYYEDNDWCLRALDLHRDPFRRCPEALAIHHFGQKAATSDFAARDVIAQRLATHARFLEVHGVLLHSGGDELRVVLGTDDPADARLLLRLVTAYGPQWFLAEWVAGDLGVVLARAASDREHTAELIRDRDAWSERARAAEHWVQESEPELVRLRQRTAELIGGRDAWRGRARVAERRVRKAEPALARLRKRDRQLTRLQHSRWWRLHRRLRPLLVAAARARRMLGSTGR